MSFCPNCGTENTLNDRYCLNCGFDFASRGQQPAEPVRQNMYGSSPDPASYTDPQQEQAVYYTPTSDKSRKTALGLSFAGIGLHYYYVGRIGWGIFHMLLGLIAWVGVIECIVMFDWHIVIHIVFLAFWIAKDAIRIATGSFRDSAKLPLKKD